MISSSDFLPSVTARRLQLFFTLKLLASRVAILYPAYRVMTKPMAILCRAKYPGRCSNCRNAIQPGETLQKSLAGIWTHRTCTDTAPKQLPPPNSTPSKHRTAAEQTRARHNARKTS